MRKSATSASAKNVRSLSVRGKAAALATTVLLAGAVQLAAADSSWACGQGWQENPVRSHLMTPSPEPITEFPESMPGTITAGGGKIQFSVRTMNTTGVDRKNVITEFGLAAKPGKPLRAKDVTVETLVNGQWKRLSAHESGGCGVLQVDTKSLGTPLEYRGLKENTFRVGLTASTSKDLTSVQLYAHAGGESSAVNVKVNHPKQPTPTKPAAPAPAAAQPSPAQAPATTAQAPATPSTAPATTAPAGTPELAMTGAGDTPKGFLAAASAAFVALGAGVLIAVRRLRPQR